MKLNTKDWLFLLLCVVAEIAIIFRIRGLTAIAVGASLIIALVAYFIVFRKKEPETGETDENEN